GALNLAGSLLFLTFGLAGSVARTSAGQKVVYAILGVVFFLLAILTAASLFASAARRPPQRASVIVLVCAGASMIGLLVLNQAGFMSWRGLLILSSPALCAMAAATAPLLMRSAFPRACAGVCPDCGYSMSGLPRLARCPECGSLATDPSFPPR